jgi:hypothetical protein
VAVTLGTSGFAPGGTHAATGPRFGDSVAGILRTHCTRCHGATEANNKLRLDGYDAVMRGGQSGPVIVSGAPEASLLLQKVLRRDRPPMPPKERLPWAEINTIRDWIQAGALP